MVSYYNWAKSRKTLEAFFIRSPRLLDLFTFFLTKLLEVSIFGVYSWEIELDVD